MQATLIIYSGISSDSNEFHKLAFNYNNYSEYKKIAAAFLRYIIHQDNEYLYYLSDEEYDAIQDAIITDFYIMNNHFIYLDSSNIEHKLNVDFSLDKYDIKRINSNFGFGYSEYYID